MRLFGLGQPGQSSLRAANAVRHSRLGFTYLTLFRWPWMIGEWDNIGNGRVAHVRSVWQQASFWTRWAPNGVKAFRLVCSLGEAMNAGW